VNLRGMTENGRTRIDSRAVPVQRLLALVCRGAFAASVAVYLLSLGDPESARGVLALFALPWAAVVAFGFSSGFRLRPPLPRSRRSTTERTLRVSSVMLLLLFLLACTHLGHAAGTARFEQVVNERGNLRVRASGETLREITEFELVSSRAHLIRLIALLMLGSSLSAVWCTTSRVPAPAGDSAARLRYRPGA
jgi:hypothetical protein